MTLKVLVPIQHMSQPINQYPQKCKNIQAMQPDVWELDRQAFQRKNRRHDMN